MAANKKLTKVLAGRTAVRITWEAAAAAVQFDDGSTMTVQTAEDATGGGGQASTAGSSADTAGGGAVLGRVRAVRQQDTMLNVDFESGSTLTLRTAEPTSSVLVRARDQTLEYAD